MLSWPFNICLWKFICKQIKIWPKFWRWFHSKRMHHCFLINFLKSVLSYASCSVRIAHCFYNIYHFFLLIFLNWFFFVFSLTPQSCKIQRLRILLCGKIIFLSKTASAELCKTGDSVNLKKKTARYTKRKTQWNWWNGTCVDLNTNMNSS